MHLLETNEISTFINYIDPDNKKSLNFAEFSNKIRPNALKTDELGRQIYIPYTAPAHELTKSMQNMLPLIRESVMTSKQFYTPNSKEGF